MSQTPAEPDQPQDPQPATPSPAGMRISDADRNRVAEVLREAAGAGRLDFEELDERLEATWAAKVYPDLVPIVADLPEGHGSLPQVPTPAQMSAAPRPPAVAPGVATRHTTSVAIMSGATRQGIWEVGDSYTAFALMGGVELDLREAVFTSSELVITANAIMGGVEITVNAGTRVVMDGVGIMGGFDQRDKVPPQLSDNSPVVRVKGVALMGGVDVVRRQMPGEAAPKLWDRKRPR